MGLHTVQPWPVKLWMFVGGGGCRGVELPYRGHCLTLWLCNVSMSVCVYSAPHLGRVMDLKVERKHYKASVSVVSLLNVHCIHTNVHVHVYKIVYYTFVRYSVVTHAVIITCMCMKLITLFPIPIPHAHPGGAMPSRNEEVSRQNTSHGMPLLCPPQECRMHLFSTLAVFTL